MEGRTVLYRKKEGFTCGQLEAAPICHVNIKKDKFRIVHYNDIPNHLTRPTNARMQNVLITYDSSPKCFHGLVALTSKVTNKITKTPNKYVRMQ